MRKIFFSSLMQIFSCSILVFLTSCANRTDMAYNDSPPTPRYDDGRFSADYSSRLPQHFDTAGNKTVVVDPNAHAWGAYDKEGNLIRAGIATSGGSSCPPDAANESDCRTGRGTFRITSMGDDTCASKTYPRPHGGGLMPFCMYFNNGQALHGSPDDIVVSDNVSHGCVRMRIPDAEWMRYNFAQVGTKVVVLPYN